MEENLFDCIVIGGGPAGIAAGIYCARKQLKTLFITPNFGGQSVVSDDIQNWIGEAHISGVDLAMKLENHLRSLSQITIKLETATTVKNIRCDDKTRFCDFEVKTDKGVYQGKTVIIATGARRRKLGVTGEDQFSGKGVAYCSTCDAPLFKGKNVVVMGGGNSGLEAVQDLFPYAEGVYLLEFGDNLRGDQVTVEAIKTNPKLKEILVNAKILEIFGENFVTGIKYQNTKTNEEKTLEVGGVFVEIGSIPNSELVKDLVQLDEHGQIMVNSKHSTTSHPGVFAAGDITDDPYKQNNIAAGDGVKAALAAYNYLLNRKKSSPAEERI